MGKRNLAQSCVLYEVTAGKQVALKYPAVKLTLTIY